MFHSLRENGFEARETIQKVRELASYEANTSLMLNLNMVPQALLGGAPSFSPKKGIYIVFVYNLCTPSNLL